MEGDDEAHAALVDVLASFALVNGRVDVEEVQRQLDASLAAAQERLPLQKEFLDAALDQLPTDDDHVNDNDDHAQTSASRQDDAGLHAELAELARERAALRQSALQVEDLETQIHALQNTCWHDHSAAQDRAQRAAERLDSLRARIDISQGRRLALMQTHVLNDAFYIWYDGAFGVINGLRLGRLPGIPVAWSEINAAWGQVALLLATLACEVNFSFSKYRVIPMGSASKLAKVGNERTSFELFYTGSFFKSSFNNAMVCILYCVRELGEYAEKTDRTMCLPYAIDGDKVGGLSVRTGGTDEVWTCALKNFLANLKWLLAWSSKRIRAPHARPAS